jgi:hypothetical protein
MKRASTLALFSISALLLLPMLAMAGQTFGEWVTGFSSNETPTRFALHTFAAFIGIFVHFVRRVMAGELDGSGGLYSYLVEQFPHRSVAMVVTQIGVGLGQAITGTLDVMPWGAVAVAGFTAGYAVDSLVNKGRS